MKNLLRGLAQYPQDVRHPSSEPTLCARGAYPEGYLEERRELLMRVAALAERYLEDLSRAGATRDAADRR
ncbi:MAG: hypothetical protein H5T74_04265 [Actinobacteria bacterium]|nr:hypothetical protein [Actinomycetota bacterium]